ncbi:MAG: hypothetical protein LBL13_06605 [Bacteroidales bacterium]|jgi:hypothetical protein|nr:hypothetical protein [Bacteroidales bacterium]
MRAIDYLDSLDSCLKYKDEVKRLIEEMNPIKYDEGATLDYYERILTADTRYAVDDAGFAGNSGEVNRFIAANVRYELFKAVEKDKSFSYLFCLLAQEQNRINPLFQSSPIDCRPLPYADNDWDFYYNVQNCGRTFFIRETKEYFENGAGKGIFEPLDFLNLLWIQTDFIEQNIDRAQTVIDHLKRLPISEKERHVLLCFIIKLAGGYPVYNFNRQRNVTYSLIAEEFLKYPENTPEKEFCRDENPEIKRKFKLFGSDILYDTDLEQLKISALKEELEERDNIISVRIPELEQRLANLDCHNVEQASKVCLSSKKGMKIDYIRVINCLCELGFFTDNNGNSIPKKDVFAVFGQAISRDLSNYDKDLSRSMSDSTALDKHLEIFNTMEVKMTEIFNSK